MQIQCHFCNTDLDDDGECASWIETVRIEPGRRTEVRTLFCLPCFEVAFGKVEDLLSQIQPAEER